MFLPNPSYLNTPPNTKTMLFCLATLGAIAIPLLFQLHTSITIVFLALFSIRLILLYFKINIMDFWYIMYIMFGVSLSVIIAKVGTIIGLEGGSSLLLLLALLKSFEEKTRRDWQIMILTMIFLLASAILFNQGLLMGLWTMICLILIITSLAMLNQTTFQVALRHSLLVFLLAFLPMTVLFIAMPRRETPLWSIPQMESEQQAKTGLSETMKPGSISDLVQSNQPIFSATFDNNYHPKQKDLYWRVMLLPIYSGTEWRALNHSNDNAVPNTNKSTISYHMILQDDKGRIPALDYPINLTQQRGLRREAGSTIRVPSRQGARRFNLQSSLNDTLPHQLSTSAQQWYTRLPENLNPKTHALAKQLWQQANANPQAYIQAAYLYFKKNQFIYTLKPPLLNSPHQTDEFIFNSKQGFCEHYADAFVVLMRAAGLPARIVTGYQGGEFNEEGGFWQIRSKDAHAWTEVWLPEQQVWKRIDPTSAVAANRIDQNITNALSENEAKELKNNLVLNKYLDRGRFYWQQWIINYDSSRQQDLLSQFGLKKTTPLILITILTIILIVASTPLWLWWKHSHSKEISPLEHGFIILKKQILGKNFPNIDSLAPIEFCQNLDKQNRLTSDIEQLINDYIILCYTNTHQPPIALATQWYKRAKKIAKQHKLPSSSKYPESKD